MKIARNGEETYQIVAGGRNRWGDYSGLALDPSDNHTFWLYNEYPATDPVNNPSEIWNTFCGSFTVGCGTCNQGQQQPKALFIPGLVGPVEFPDQSPEVLQPVTTSIKRTRPYQNN